MMQAQGAVPCTTLGKGRFGKVYQVGTNDGLVVKRTKTDASSLCETTTLQQLQGIRRTTLLNLDGRAISFVDNWTHREPLDELRPYVCDTGWWGFTDFVKRGGEDLALK